MRDSRGEYVMAKEQHGFIDHGAPARVAAAFSRGAGADSTGNPVLYQAFGQSPDPFFLLATNLRTGESRQYPCAQAGSNYPWGMCVASDGCVYIGSCCDAYMHVYDPKTDEFRTLGHASETETYIWALTEGTDGKIYGCTYPNCKLVRWDPKEEKFDDLGRCDPTEEYLRNIISDSDGFIYAGIGPARAGFISYEIATGKLNHLVPDSERGPGWGNVFKAADGGCYCQLTIKDGDDTHDRVFRLRKGEAEEINPEDIPSRAPIKFLDGSIVSKIGPKEMTIKDAGDKEKSIAYSYDAPGTHLFVLIEGPDGKIYISSILPLYLCSLDPDTGATEFLGEACTSGGEVYSFANLNGKLYMFSYPGCAVSSYDPTKPYKPGRESSANPYMLPQLSRFAYRPYCCCPAPDGKKIVVGGIPDYGMLGGSLAVFDPEIDRIEAEYPNVVRNQSITGLCVTEDGFICGGSSIEPGSGGHPTEKEAVIFLWDYEKREMVFETVPLPGVAKISSMISAKDGLVYGLSCEGHLVVFDPAARKLVRAEKLPYGLPAFTSLAQADNGKLIALIGGGIIEISPDTYAHRLLAKWENGIGGGIAVTKGRVYFLSGSHVVSYGLPEN